jgi:hypothetical protein
MTMQGRLSLTIQPTSLQQYMLSSLTSDNSSTSFMNAPIRGSLLPLLPPQPPLLPQQPPLLPGQPPLLVVQVAGGLLLLLVLVVVAVGVLIVLLLPLLSARSMLKILTATCGCTCTTMTGQDHTISNNTTRG